MARIRTIKPEFWTSSKVMRMSPLARLAFIGMWNFCDDGGVHQADCFRLKAEVFPSDPISITEVEAMVQEMIEVGLLVEYSCESKTYWCVTGWNHQVIHKKTIKYPQWRTSSAPVAHQPVTSSAPDSDECATSALPVHDQCATSTPRKGNRKGKGSRKGNNPHSPPEGELMTDSVPEQDSIPEENHPQKETPSESEPSLPESLRTPEFQAAFAEWLAFKRERGEKYKPTGLRKLISTLEKWGPEVAIERINFSISSNYAGIFPPKSSNARASPRGGWHASSEPVQTEEDLPDIGTEEGLRELEKLAAGGAFGRRRSAVPEPPEVDF